MQVGAIAVAGLRLGEMACAAGPENQAPALGIALLQGHIDAGIRRGLVEGDLGMARCNQRQQARAHQGGQKMLHPAAPPCPAAASPARRPKKVASPTDRPLAI